MSGTVLCVLALVVAVLSGGVTWLARRAQEKHTPVQVAFKLNDRELGQTEFNLREWRAMKRCPSRQLDPLLLRYGLVVDATRPIEIGRLSGNGGGPRRRLSIPVISDPGDQRIPGWLVARARW